MTKKLTKDPIIGKAEKMAIGDRIRLLRGKETRKSFCERLDLGISTLINYEKNSRVPDATFVAKLCETYNVTADWLVLGSTGEPVERQHPTNLANKKCTNVKQGPPLNATISPSHSAGTNNWALELSPAAFKSLWDEYWSEREVRRGWLQIEVIKRFPEFVEWLEQRPAPLKPAQIAALKKDDQLLHRALPSDLLKD